MIIVAILFGLAALLPPAALAGGLNRDDAKQYRAAFEAAGAGKWTRAERKAARAKNRLPAKALAWLRYKSAGSGAPFEAIDDFLAANPDWPSRAALRRRAEEAMGNRLSDDAALAWFAGNPPLSAPGNLRYAHALIAKGRTAEAAALVRKTWRELDMNRAEERDFRRAFRKLLRREDHIARLDRLIWDQRVYAARRQMRRVGRDRQNLAQARLHLMLRIGGVDRAIARVPVALHQDPGLIYERLRWRRQKGFTDRAIELLRDPPVQMVRPYKWWAERAILARRAMRDGNITLAYRLARDHRQNAGAPYAEAEWLSGWIALRYLGDTQVALRHFTRLYNGVRYPISRARGAYWIARAIEADRRGGANRAARAKNWYRIAAQYTTTFYGQLAVDRLRQTAAVRLPPEPKPSAAAIVRFEKREIVRVTRMLALLRQEELVAEFVARLAEMATSSTEWALTARLAADIGRNDLAIRVAKLALRRGIALTAAGYPKLETSRPIAGNAALIHAVVRQESAFDPTAISHAGARGLMQLMPATAKQIARQLKLRHSKRRLTADPLHNISLGSAYLDRLRENYDGSLILTLAAYNAGPGNVRRWLRQYGDPRALSTLDAIDWIEAIPISETRNYVQRVLENLTVYGYRFENAFAPELIVDAMTGSQRMEYP